MRCRTLVVGAFLVLCSSIGNAQQATAGYTRMILGGGLARIAPVFTFGVERKPDSSRMTWRVMAEYGQHIRGFRLDDGSGERLYGLQMLAVREFRAAHRVQPYVLAGAGLSHELRYFTAPGAANPTDLRATTASFLWGTGINVRVRGLTMFGEVKLPTFGSGSYPYGSYAPLTFGIRF